MSMKKVNFNENINFLEIDPEFVSYGVNYAKNNECFHLRIIDLNTSIKRNITLDLSSLHNDEKVLSLDVSDEFKINMENYTFLCSMKNIVKLSINCSDIDVDFHEFNKLEELYIKSIKKSMSKITSKKIKHLLLISVKNKDLEFISELSELSELRISGGGGGNHYRELVLLNF